MANPPPLQLPPGTSEFGQNKRPPQHPPSVPEHFLYKNRLQQYVQKLSLPLPVYQTHNEGAPHAPLFRSTVLVDNTYYMSQNVFTNLKPAEQDVAKIALDALMQKVKDDGSPYIHEDIIYCKAILNEYAAKVHLELPTYRTTQQQQEGHHTFTSSLVFNGVTFTGPAARNKKEAEQLAARVAIQSIMGNPGPDSAVISKIIKSKYRPSSNKVNASNNTNKVVVPMVTNHGLASGSPLNKGKEIVNTGVTSNVCTAATINKPLNQVATLPVPNQPFHEFKKPRLDTPTALITPPIEFVPPAREQPVLVGPSSAKKRRKKGKKNHLPIAQLPYSVAPTNQVPCLIPQ